MKKSFFQKSYRIVLALLALYLLTQLSTPANAAPSQVVSQGVPTLDGTIWGLGVNYAWHDFGNDFTDNNWSTRFSQIKTDFDNMAAKGVKVVRWWVFAGLASGSPLWTGTGHGSTVTGLPSGWVQNMIAATNYAYSKGIRIYYCFVSFDIAATYNGSTQHDDIVDNLTVQKSFLDNAVKPIAQGLGNNPGVFGWDIINEPEWIINSADGGNPGSVTRSFPLATMRTFVTNMANTIHLYAKQPVSLGSASMKWIGGQYDFWSGLPLDFYDFHWYDWATPYFNPMTTDASTLKVDGKPVILGEVMPNMQGSSVGKTHQQVLELILQHGYSGYLTWAWTDTANDTRPYIAPDFANFMAAHPELNFGGTPQTGSPTPTVPATATTPGQTPTIQPPTNTPNSPTATSTVIPTIPSTNGLSVGIKSNGTDNNQQTAFAYQLKNTGGSAASGLSVRIYFTTDNGNAAANYAIEKYYDQSGVATISGPTLASGNTYYFIVSYGTASLAAGASWEFQSALHLGNWGSNFDGSNDWYHSGYAVAALPAAYTTTNTIPAYVNATLVWGAAPGGSTATNTVVPPTATKLPATNTPVPPTATKVPATSTQIPATNTAVPATATLIPATATRIPVTATKPPATNTPAPTASGGLTVQIRGNGTDNNQQTQFAYMVKNTGSSSVSGVTVRLYFTADNGNAASNYTIEKYYDQSGVATISGPTLVSGSTYYYTVSYGTASLAAGASWEFQTALHLSNWGTNFSGVNDWYHMGYAAAALPAAYTNTNYVPAYVNGTLVWGATP